MSLSADRAAGLALVGMLFLLFSTDIGPEPPLPPLAPVVEGTPAAPAQASSAPKGPRQRTGTRSDRALLPTKGETGLDRVAFLAAFKRQAQEALLPCLRGFKPSPASLPVTATLDKAGHLLQTAPLSAAEAVPACFAPAVAVMHFEGVAAGLTRNTVGIQWRIDW